MAFSKNNPHIDKDGNVIQGQLHDAFAFERERELERRKSLPPEEVAALEAAEENLARKMNT